MAAPPANALSVDAAVLELFWSLASVDADKRQVAAVQLATELSKAQHEFDAARLDAGDSSLAAGDAAPLVSYSLRRLTRGLGSGRQGARQGFALALTGALAAVRSVSGDAALEILHKNSEPVTGASKGVEARDIYLGKLFGYASVARALDLRRRQDGVATPDAALLGRMAQEVATLARKKGYLREAGAAILLEMLGDVSAHALHSVLKAAPALSEWLTSPLEAADAEAVLLALALCDRLPAELAARCSVLPPAPRGRDALCERAHLERLLPALLSSTSAHPRVHSVWAALVPLVARGAAASAGAAAVFWDVVCEQNLFTSSHERKYLGFEVFSLLLPGLPAASVPALFSNNFMRCMVNNLTKEDTLLHASTARCLANLLAHVQSEAGAGLQTAVIAALQRFAGGRFDRLTQTGAISSLMQGLSGDSAEEYVETLTASFHTGAPVGGGAGGDPAEEGGEEEVQRSVTGRRVWSIEQLCGICKSAKTSASLQLRILRFLLLHAFFDILPGGAAGGLKLPELRRGAPAPALAPSIRELCRTRLFGLLGDALSLAHATAKEPQGAPKPPADDQAAAAAAEAAARQRRAQECAAQLVELGEVCAQAERSRAQLSLAQPLDQRAAAVRKGVRALLPELERLAASGAGGGEGAVQAEAALTLLRILLLLQLGAPADYSADMEDLPRCLRATLGGAGGADEAEAGAEDAEGSPAPHPMDVLVEVLLSLLSKPSALSRDAVERTFRAFAGGVTREGMRCMMREVARSAGRRRSSAAAEGSEDDESDDEEEEEEEEEGGEEAAQQGRRLGGARASPSESSDEEEEGDAMDDDAMFRADALLAAVLTQAKVQKLQKKTAAEAVTHFKFRVLSLVEAFVKAQPSSPLLPEMVLPLLRALVAATQGAPGSEALASRIAALLTRSVCKAPTTSAAAVPVEQLRSCFATCMKRASRALVPTVAKAAQAACVYLLRLLAATEGEAGGEVTPLVTAALEDFFASKRCRLPHAFFITLLERFPCVSGAVVECLAVRLAGYREMAALNARAEFLAVEALKLTAAALRHKPGSPAAVAVVAQLRPAAAMQGLTAALELRFSKAKRQTELYKHAVGCTQALLRLCQDQQLDTAPLRAAAAAAKTADPLPPPKAIGQLDRLVAVVQQAGGGGGVKRAKGGAVGDAPEQKKHKVQQ